jgi:hypothetical protein
VALVAAAALVVRAVREVRVDAAAPATPVQRVAWFQAAQEAAWVAAEAVARAAAVVVEMEEETRSHPMQEAPVMQERRACPMQKGPVVQEMRAYPTRIVPVLPEMRACPTQAG